MRKSMFLGLLVLLAALGVLTQARGQTDVKETVIDVEDLDCEGCGAVVEISLKEVPGVAKIKLDFDKQTATVTPQPKTTLSAKALWEAVEESGFIPTKLVGPSGTFTKKPAS